MNTAQIITFIILAIIMIWSFIKVVYGINVKKPKAYLYLFLISIILMLLFMLGIILVLETNDLRTQVKNKCPEYEKIENVYKLKQ